MTVLDIGACFCGQPATRLIGTVPYCAGCAETVLAPLRAKHPSNGQQTGPLRPDYGPGWAELRCTTCGYEWVGHIGEPCGRCVQRLEADRKTNLALVKPSNNGDNYEPPPDPTEWDQAPAVAVELIDWATLNDRPDEIVEGLILPGRWTALAAKAKAGKTTLEMACSVAISQGRDPFDGHTIDPVTVLYVDAEMGRLDLAERLHELGYDPATLTNWHATDLPPRLDTPVGGDMLVTAARQLGARVVVIDGINGTVTGAEKDDLVWRAFYDYTIYPLKRAGVAILTGDNLGKDATLGPRGSSVKVDKPDGVILLSRTDDGVKLTTRERRTSAYPLERVLAIDGLDGTGTIRYKVVHAAWPAGTADAVARLDRLQIPLDHGRGKVREVLQAAGQQMSDTVLSAAIRWRRIHSNDDLNLE